MFQSVCHTDPALLKREILQPSNEDGRIIIDLSSVHSHTDFFKKYPVSNIAEQPQFNLRKLLEISSDLMFTVDYFLLYMERFEPEIQKVQPRTFNRIIHNAFIDRDDTDITVNSVKAENFDSLVKELKEHIILPTDCQLENVEWGGNYIKLLKPRGLFPVLHYLYESLASDNASGQLSQNKSRIGNISIIDTDGKLFNHTFTFGLIPILSRLNRHGVCVTHNHCCYNRDYRKWEKSIVQEVTG